MDARVGQDVHFAIEQLLEILTETHHVQQGTIWFHVDEEVDVASGVVIAAGNPTKQPEIARAVPPGDLHDLVSLALEVHGSYIV